MRAFAVFCLVLSLAACSRKGSEEPRAQKSAAVPVTVATVEAKAVPVEVCAIGTVQTLATVSVKPRVNGELARVFFTVQAD
jgi:multidrug efflux system membrane fusion protein